MRGSPPELLSLTDNPAFPWIAGPVWLRGPSAVRDVDYAQQAEQGVELILT